MFERLSTSFYCVVLIFSSLLFFFRTRAVFNRDPWVVSFFAGLWLAVLGGSLTFFVDAFIPSGSNSTTNIMLCFSSGINPFIAATTIISLINDTLVFLAISWRLYRNSYDPYTLNGGIRSIIFGDYLPIFSKALLQDGQAYYLLALSWSNVSYLK